MASCLQKLLKKSPPARLIFPSQTRQSLNLTTPSLLLNSQTGVDTKRDHHHHNFDSVPQTTDKLTNFTSSLFYPSFPFGFSVGPIFPIGSIHSETNDCASGDGSGMVWADSVKKKRKKKMNKHKYKKLRKRLRRQT